MNPPADDHHENFGEADSAADLTLAGALHASAPVVADDKPYNLAMYLDFLPGTD
ncbi:MAG: hypothetical protein JNM75_02665 [Rhodospirillales bacterium]|nr:hypothetical protein [Rhodospirillales bacterium]